MMRLIVGILKGLDEKFEIKQYGSFETKLLTPFSDLDLMITHPSREFSMSDCQEILMQMNNLLSKSSNVRNLKPILQTTIPVLKLDGIIEDQQKRIQTVKIDLIVDIKDSERNASHRTTDYLKKCISTYPTLQQNIILLKYVLKLQDLSNSYTGGLNAYGLCLLYIAYLKVNKKLLEK